MPLPEHAQGQPGLFFADLDGDGAEDLLFSNSERYGVYLYNTKKHLGFEVGWSYLIREGKAGEPDALPLTTAGKTEIKDDALWIAGQRIIALPELCRPPAPLARSPQDSLKAIHVKPGFQVELVAHEPLVQDPIFIDWDAQGRMWVVEMSDYPFHEWKGQTHHGRAKVLEDTDGDGRYDKATLFLDDLQYPTGLACWKGGVFVASVPSVFYAEDTDHDGKADKRTPILEGFKVGNPQHLVNGFTWGLDGWFYGGNGDSGGIVTDVSTGKKHDLSGRDFRFNPQTGEFQLQPGRAQYGRHRDDFGNWFANSNANLGWHYFLEDRYLARNPKLAVPTMKQNLNPSGTALFPVSAPLRRFNFTNAVNQLTSGCNPMPYRDTVLGSDYASSLFICEPANNLVHREVLSADGVSFTSHRASDEPDREFLASEDNWSRFTQARTGPDGCLYVVDMYRLIIEHPEWIPKPMIESLDLRAGSTMGRIYRVSPTGHQRAAREISLTSDNGPARDIAQRQLIESGSTWHTDTLTGSTAARIQQLWTMHTLHTLPMNLLVQTMRDQDSRLREHAVRIGEHYLSDAHVLEAMLKLTTDADLRVRVQLAFSLGESRDPRIADVLATMVKHDAELPAMLIAALSSAPDHAEATNWMAKLKAKPQGTSGATPPKIVTHINPDRDKVVKAYASVATLTGDAAKGHVLYTAICSSCHRLKGEGTEIGPDLGTIAGKPTEQLLEAILDPNRAVEQRFLAHTITLKSGKVISGMIAEESANSLTLKLGGATEVILRSDIAKRESSDKSLMLEGLETVLNPQQVADVLAWIRAPN